MAAFDATPQHHEPDRRRASSAVPPEPVPTRIDASDPRVDPYRSLRDPDLVRAGEGAGWFIGEQALVIERMLARTGTAVSILASERMAERAVDLVRNGSDRDVPILVASDEVIESIVGFDLHRGLLALGRRPEDGLARIEAALADPSRPVALLACEEIRNIDNIGLLFRNAAAFGVEGVLLSPGCHDPLYRKSLRVSIGHALDIPFARIAEWPQGLAQFRDRHRLTLIGTATETNATAVHRIDPPDRLLLLVGSEFPGVTAAARSHCDRLARIPMAPGVDSLNVAVAAAACLAQLCGPRLEASRQARGE